jgi:phosphatidylinositol-4-phosphate 3-kinase
MAEALQMEYDALSRLRHHKEESRAKQNTEPSLISWDEPALDFYSKPAGRRTDLKLLRGLSGSDPTLNYNSISPPEGLPNSTSQDPQPGPDPWPKGSLSGDYLYIFDGSEGRCSLSPGSGDTDGSCKKLSPPPLPPRVSIWDAPPLPPRKGSPSPSKISQPNDINSFSSAEQPPDKLLVAQDPEEGELPDGRGQGHTLGSVDYDGINDAITRLNLKSTYDSEISSDATRGWKEGRGPLDFNKDTSGKPVARSKTMPPQVPPRTYTSRYANRKNATPGNNRRISAAPVRTFLCIRSERKLVSLCHCKFRSTKSHLPFSRPFCPRGSWALVVRVGEGSKLGFIMEGRARNIWNGLAPFLGLRFSTMATRAFLGAGVLKYWLPIGTSFLK